MMAPTEHPSELLSDVAAGETGPEIEAAVQHVATCDECAAIVEDERAVRSLLGDLPPVEPPAGFFADLIRRRHRHAIVAVACAVIVAAGAWALVVDDTSGVTGQVQPDVDALRDRHMDSADSVPADFEPMLDDQPMPAPYQEPSVLAGSYAMAARFHGTDGTMQVTYSDGVTELSLFEQAGELDEDDLPGGMEPVDLGDGGWELAGGPVRVVVVRRGDLIYTLVGEVDRPVIEQAVRELPSERPMALSRRVTIAVNELIEDLGFGL